MWADKEMSISTVIVIVAVGNLLFPACEKEPRAYRKKIQGALVITKNVLSRIAEKIE